MSGRDLSAFSLPPRAVAVAPPSTMPLAEIEPRVERAEPEELAPTIVPPPEMPEMWDDLPRRKVTTSIPARLHRRLRAEAESSDRFKADLVIEALRTHANQLIGAKIRPARRRVRVEDATQCQLYLTEPERQELDELAHRLGLSRSGVVTALLERNFPAT